MSHRCKCCGGRGKVRCPRCEGDGTIQGSKCYYCQGEGEVKCKACDGKGEVED